MFRKGSFTKNVAVLMSGTAISQGILIAAAPILSRLYTPDAYGIFTLFTSIVIILSVVATWRYELAIVLPKKDEDAVNVMMLSAFCVVLTSLFSAILILFFGDWFVKVIDAENLKPWLWWIPISIFATGIYQSLNYWSTRTKHFGEVSISRSVRSVGTVGVQIPVAFVNAGPVGLVSGYIIGQVVASFALAVQILKKYKTLFKDSFQVQRTKELAKEYAEFPKYSSPQAFINAVSQNIPSFLLAFYFGPEAVGLYSLSHRLLSMPITLITQSVKQVFFQKSSEAYNNGQNVYKLLRKATLGLFGIGIIPSIVVILFGPPLFAFVLGAEWYDGGAYAQWMISWLFFAFVNSPAFVVAQIYGFQKQLMYYEIGLFVFRAIALVIGGMYFTDLGSIALYSIVGAIYNGLLIYFVLQAAKKRQPEQQPA
ncbi:oligosaccharide flippase family protein [Bacillus sp. JJ1533]|uniref:lipopolysaccharide biosynthesis protein n=1 Tax=Bacillus sp. JJ1533 TaxID=3122959 RepID=UPI003000891F